MLYDTENSLGGLGRKHVKQYGVVKDPILVWTAYSLAFRSFKLYKGYVRTWVFMESEFSILGSR